LDRILRHPGALEDGAYQIHVPLNRLISDTTTRVTLPYLMEASTLLMFQPLDGGKVAINGDFAMTADQTNPVISALHDHGIGIVSLHSHLTHEQPRLFICTSGLAVTRLHSPVASRAPWTPHTPIRSAPMSSWRGS
jgi:hypothetical protein